MAKIVVIVENGIKYQTFEDILPKVKEMNLLFIGKVPAPNSVLK